MVGTGCLMRIVGTRSSIGVLCLALTCFFVVSPTWSEGSGAAEAPRTADDVLFLWESVTPDDLSPSGPPGWSTVGDSRADIEKFDRTAFRIRFGAPSVLFTQMLELALAGALHIQERHVALPRLGEAHDIESAAVFSYDWPKALRFVAEAWTVVGIHAYIVVRDRNGLDASRNHSTHDAAVWTGSGGLDPILEPDRCFPAGGESEFATETAWWYLWSDTFPQELSSEAALRQMAFYDRLKAPADAGLQDELMRRILDISAEDFYPNGILMPEVEDGES